MKVTFAWLDKKGKTKWPITPSFGKYWNGEIWIFSIWKWSLTIDLRKKRILGLHYKDPLE